MSDDEFTDAEFWAGRPVAYKVADAEPRGRLVATGLILSDRVTSDYGAASCECRLDDGTGEVTLLFLGRPRVSGMIAGTVCRVEGTARIDRGRLGLWNPLYRIEAAEGGHPSL